MNLFCDIPVMLMHNIIRNNMLDLTIETLEQGVKYAQS